MTQEEARKAGLILGERVAPCPFCGKDETDVQIYPHTGGWFVTCTECLACGPWGDTVQNAADAWNDRVGGEA